MALSLLRDATLPATRTGGLCTPAAGWGDSLLDGYPTAAIELLTRRLRWRLLGVLGVPLAAACVRCHSLMLSHRFNRAWAGSTPSALE